MRKKKKKIFTAFGKKKVEGGGGFVLPRKRFEGGKSKDKNRRKGESS